MSSGRIKIVVLCAMLAAVATPLIAKVAASTDPQPLKVWVVSDSGVRSRTFDGGSLPAYVGVEDRLPDGGFGITVVIENPSAQPAQDVTTSVPGAADCGRAIGTVGAGSRSAYRCVIADSELALGEPYVLDPQSWPPGTWPGRLKTFDGEVRVADASGLAVDAPRIRVSAGEADLPDLAVELTASTELSGGRRWATIEVTNPAPLERLIGHLDLEARWSLVAPNQGDGLMECGALPDRIAPGTTVQTRCTWPSHPGAGYTLVAGLNLDDSMRYATQGSADPLPSPLVIDVTPRRQLASTSPAEFTITVTNTGSSPVADASVEPPLVPVTVDGSVQYEPALAGCARDLGTLAPVESRSWTCSGPIDFGGTAHFEVSGTVPGQIDRVAATKMAEVISYRVDADPEDFRLEIVPPFQEVSPGTEAEVVLRLQNLDRSGLWDLSIFDEQFPQCDRSRSLFAGLNWWDGGAREYRCKIAVPAGGDVVFEPTAVLRRYLAAPSFDGEFLNPEFSRWTAVSATAVLRPSDSGQVSIAITPLESTIRNGSDTEVEVAVTNHSALPLVGARAWLIGAGGESHDQTVASTVGLAEDCDRSLGSLAAGSTFTYRCRLDAPSPGWAFGEDTTTSLTGYVNAMSGDVPVADTATAAIDLIGSDRLDLELIGPDTPLQEGDLAEFRVRVTNRGGVRTGEVSVWSTDLPACDHVIDGDDLVPGSTEPVVEYSCFAQVDEELGITGVTLRAAGVYYDEGWTWGSTPVVARASIDVEQVPPVTTAPPLTTEPTTAAPEWTAVAIDAGVLHTCAVTAAGGAKCWGSNSAGQLGDGTTAGRSNAADVEGLTSGVAAVGSGQYHSCALMAAGGVKCWGENVDGQLGDGSTVDSLVPVDVTGLSAGIESISVGGFHACAVTTAGGVECWGHNWWGALGDGSDESRTVAAPVPGLADVVAVAAGTYHSCALTATGSVKCWGRNNFGQIGDGTTTDRFSPVDVWTLSSGVSGIDANWRRTCAVTTSGEARCWGTNESGQIGDGTTSDRLLPTMVQGLSDVTSAATGGSHTCSLGSAGNVRCWGSNSSGQVGDDTLDDRFTPVDVVGLASGAKGLTAGNGHSCALTEAGGVKCWGNNSFGQLGDDTTINRLTPVDVVGFEEVVEPEPPSTTEPEPPVTTEPDVTTTVSSPPTTRTPGSTTSIPRITTPTPTTSPNPTTSSPRPPGTAPQQPAPPSLQPVPSTTVPAQVQGATAERNERRAAEPGVAALQPEPPARSRGAASIPVAGIGL